ncbi:MAG: histidinol-phosphate transaminase [Muribaculaceae bacterium]
MALKDLVRPNIWNLKPYSCARNEFKGDASVWLDANENPFNAPYNRYPDPLQLKVKEGIANIRGVDSQNIFLGVGSDECIDLAYRIFCEPSVDNVVAISPTYGMYEVCADINNVEYRKVSLDDCFDINPQSLLDAIDENTKIMWICSPNNPTGNAFDIAKLKYLCKEFSGIVVIDEAYIDFSDKGSMLDYLKDFPRLIVMQTFSKAWGSAATRLGIAFANTDIIALYNKVKYPYNINLLTQDYALKILNRHTEILDWVSRLLANRVELIDSLKSLKYVQRIYPTDANFVLVRVNDADSLYDYLCQRGIIVRNRNRVEKCLGCVRITVGETNENEELINALKDYE